jgi:hypothetical protein
MGNELIAEEMLSVIKNSTIFENDKTKTNGTL